MYLFIAWQILPLLGCINQISKCTMCTCCGKLAGLFSHNLLDIDFVWFGSLRPINNLRYWKRIVPIAIIRRKFSASKLNSPSRLSTNYRNTTFWRLETDTRIADVTRSFGCSERTIYRLQTRLQWPGCKNDKPPLGRPRIMTRFEVKVIVTSTWRNRFMAAWKLLIFLSHATDTRISNCTARNRLRGARLIFELWNLNFNIDHFVNFWWRKWSYFQKVLLKMFTFVRHYMNFILSKVLSILWLSNKIIAHSVCTD